jgi:hypothetical protein
MITDIGIFWKMGLGENYGHPQPRVRKPKRRKRVARYGSG